MRRISSHISVTLLVVFVIGSLLLFLIVNQVLSYRLQNQLREDLRKQCRMTQFLLERSQSIQNDVRELARQTGIRITIVAADGSILADSERDPAGMDNHLNRPEIQEALGAEDGTGSSIRHSETIGEDLVYVALRTPHRTFIRLAERQAFLQEIVSGVRVVFFLASAGAIVILLVLIHFLARRITRPLSEIVRAAEEIKNGNYQKEIRVSESNEVGDLARIVNEMSAKLKGDIETLSRLQDVRRDFVANASHELRTPVSSIKGYLETLSDGAILDADVSRRFLERALSNVDRLEMIINDMLDLSQLESRDRGLSLRHFNPAETLQSISEEFEEAAKRKGLTVTFHAETPRGFMLMADPYQFEKAVVNLVANAIKYTDAGHVRIRLYSDGQLCSIDVEDTGPGIPAEDVSRIFERFYRVDKGRSRQTGGSGLGLSIVKHVMEIHGGTVLVQSEPGKGTTFTLHFPILKPSTLA